MQPVLRDLKSFQEKWKSNSSLHLDEKTRWEQRPIYLRVLDVALLTLMLFSLSAAVCLCLTGVVTLVTNGNALLTFGRLIAGGGLALLSYELFKLRDIADRCRSIFREALRAFNPDCPGCKSTKYKKEDWDERVTKVVKEYEELYFLDSVIDKLYSMVVNH